MALVITRGISIFLIPIYTAYFKPQEFGVIAILLIFGVFLNSIVSIQFEQGLGRFIAERTLSSSKKKLIASTAIWFLIVIHFLAFCLLTMFPSKPIDLISGEIRIPNNLFILAVGSFCLNGIYYILEVMIRFLRKKLAFIGLSFSHAIGNILLIIFFVKYLNFGIEGIFIASILTTSVIMVIQMYVLKEEFKFSMQRNLLFKLIKFSLPLVPAAIAFNLIKITDRYFIKEFHGFANLGIYDLGVRLSAIVGIILIAFEIAFKPIIFSHHQSKRAKSDLGIVFNYIAVLGSLGVLMLSLFSKELLILLANESYYETANILPILFFVALMMAISRLSPGLLIEGKTKIIGIIYSITAILNIIICYFLVKNFNIYGAALTALVTVCFSSVLYFYYSQKYFPVPLNISKISFLVCGFILLLVFGCYILPTYNLEYINSILIKLIIISIYLLFCLKIGLIKITDLNIKSITR